MISNILQIFSWDIALPCFQVHKFPEVSNLVRQQKVFVLTVLAYTWKRKNNMKCCFRLNRLYCFQPQKFKIHFSTTYPFPSDVTSTVATVACDCRGHPASPWLLCSSATNWITTGYSASTSLKLVFAQINLYDLDFFQSLKIVIFS